MPRRWAREFKRKYARTLTKDVVLLDGAKETVDALRSVGYKVAIYTLKMRNHAMKILDHFSLGVDGLLAGDEIGEEKASGKRTSRIGHWIRKHTRKEPYRWRSVE